MSLYDYYDDEAVYQDADILQAEYEAEGRRVAALKRRGVCTHGSSVGLGADGQAHYPEAEGLVGEQRRCTDGCGRVFENDEDWYQARREVLG